jgi:hypothetical protein
MIRLSDEAIQLLDEHGNRSEFIDRLLRGEIAQVKCPYCNKVFTIKTK